LELGSVSHPNLFFFKVGLAILGHLYFPKILGSVCKFILKKFPGTFVGISLSLQLNHQISTQIVMSVDRALFFVYDMDVFRFFFLPDCIG
jgi:hypothetical protein